MYCTNFSLNITWSILASIPQWIFYLISQADTHYGAPPDPLKTAHYHFGYLSGRCSLRNSIYFQWSATTLRSVRPLITRWEMIRCTDHFIARGIPSWTRDQPIPCTSLDGTTEDKYFLQFKGGWFDKTVKGQFLNCLQLLYNISIRPNTFELQKMFSLSSAI